MLNLLMQLQLLMNYSADQEHLKLEMKGLQQYDMLLPYKNIVIKRFGNTYCLTHTGFPKHSSYSTVLYRVQLNTVETTYSLMLRCGSHWIK